MFHRYQIVYANDADYIVWESLQHGEWIEHCRWNINGGLKCRPANTSWPVEYWKS